MPETIEALVDGGNATAGPPLRPALGPIGINIMDVINEINDKTKAFDGMKVPVKVIVDPKTKSFDIQIGTPPTSILILKELGIEKGSGAQRQEKAGDLTMEQVKRVVAMKEGSLLGGDLKMASKEVLGTCLSMGVTVDGKDPRDIQIFISEGKYDDELLG